MPRTLLIGCGLVGSQIINALSQNGERPIVLDNSPQLNAISSIVDLSKFDILSGSVLDFSLLESIVRDYNVNKIVHTAANQALTEGARGEPYDAIKLNVMGTANVLEAARKRNVERVVFTSSSVLYFFRKGGLESGQLSEDNYPHPTTIYATTKLAGENLGRNYADMYGLEFVALRLAAVFGPWSGKGGGGRLSSMFREAIENSLEGREVSFSPRAVDYVYSKDAARAVLLALQAKKEKLTFGTYNIGMGKIYSSEEIASFIESTIPSARICIEKISNERSPVVSTERAMSLKRSHEELGYSPSFEMAGALADYIEWYHKKEIKR